MPKLFVSVKMKSNINLIVLSMGVHGKIKKYS